MATNWTCVECRMEVLFTAHGARVAKIRIKDLKPAAFFGGERV